MKKLWAPWRSRYVRHLDQATSKCIFCSKSKQKKDPQNYIIHRAKYCYAVLNIYPYNNGHILVVPYRHVEDLSQLQQEEVLEMIHLVCEMQKRLKKSLRAAGFNIGLNVGKEAGAGFNHLHIHIVPRWRGDTNFMPILTETKIISESLNEVYRLLTK